ncbi:X-Pro dipeptidyl-peptidase [Desulfocucumis palustris]|uniref:X-Pro dipeptidyl-peptidase n=1 Tax=Desulfocucumis palustris TaxID=1898651 RepID=A0A2L2XB63_9FIRM|nr:CocE/NonD family hydrolase [Desulfocucumis palustris]GBF33224.1 X-Pro dipeptidyl-peptidase [Desulfocucumis palustris]
MSAISRTIARMYKLLPAETYNIAVDKALEIPMHDDVILRADRYYPRHKENLPTLLVRTPYGRSRLGTIWGYIFAERGFQVLIQSCRGTDDSEGEISPFRGEGEDGMATLEWIKNQNWFDGRLGMAGPSYMGFTQWVIARDAGTMLKAFCTQVTTSEFFTAIHPGGSFALEIFLQWVQITNSFSSSIFHYLRSAVNMKRVMKAAISHLPLRAADEIVVGKPMKYWRDWLQHTNYDEWWSADDYSDTVASVTAPNHLISGWYDFLLQQLLRDYDSLEKAGRRPYLTIGPWAHSSNGLAETGLRESLIWLNAHILGKTEALRTSPVRIYVMGANEWRDLSAWPPSNTQNQHWYLQPESALNMVMPPDSHASQFRYDPNNPTPNVGGATNATLARGTGAMDNRKLEARPDVLIFTSTPLEQDTEVIGPVSAELYVNSSLAYTDFFVRLCDVLPSGESMNICDGLLRLTPGNPEPVPDGILKINIMLSPTAYRFRRGHCIRVQVSSGAHPRFARNTGSGEPLATAATMRVADQKVYHDPAHPSSILLPILL